MKPRTRMRSANARLEQQIARQDQRLARLERGITMLRVELYGGTVKQLRDAGITVKAGNEPADGKIQPLHEKMIDGMASALADVVKQEREAIAKRLDALEAAAGLRVERAVRRGHGTLARAPGPARWKRAGYASPRPRASPGMRGLCPVRALRPRRPRRCPQGANARMTKPRLTQESAARIAVGWMHLRPDEVPAVAKSLARNIYAALVTAGVPGPEANDLAAEFGLRRHGRIDRSYGRRRRSCTECPSLPFSRSATRP